MLEESCPDAVGPKREAPKCWVVNLSSEDPGCWEKPRDAWGFWLSSARRDTSPNVQATETRSRAQSGATDTAGGHPDRWERARAQEK